MKELFDGRDARPVAASHAGLDPASMVPRNDGLRVQPAMTAFSHFPEPVHDMLALGHARMLEYQGPAYAHLYLDRLQQVLAAKRVADPGAVHEFAITREIARWLALWMAFDDSVRVADLKRRGTRWQRVTREVKAGAGFGRYGVLALIMVMYLVLGCLMDPMAMIILTVPIIFPVITQLGFGPIWFGIILVMTVELGLIHPPVGMNVFVIKSVVKDVSFSTIFKGVLPFVATDILRLSILISFPAIALLLPSRM